MTIRVRPATLHDVAWIVGELRAFAAFFGTRRSLFPPDPAYAEQQLLQLMDPAVGYFGLAERVTQESDELTATPLGFIVGLRSPHYFNPTLTTLTELFWWVAPTHRGTSAGARLLEAFTAHGRATADWVVLALEAHSPVDPRSLERRGFHVHETSYLLEV